MKKSIEKVQVISVTEKVFTDKETGERKTYYACNSISESKDFFRFNVYSGKPLEGQEYMMYLTSDNYMKPRVVFEECAGK